MSKEHFCTECYSVFQGGYGKCCGAVEEFDPKKHGSLLIALSNAWITVEKEWKDHPLLREISDEHTKDGCFSAATVFNAFIEKLDRGVE